MASSSEGEIPGLRPAGLIHHRDIVVESNYSKIGEHLRQVTSPEIQCSVFCGGRRCRYDSYDCWKPEEMAIDGIYSHWYDSYDCWKPEEMAIDGIYSHWVTDSILAMARPNTDVIIKKNVVSQFLENDIKTLINLQLSGEHASCGGALHESGFSYDPNVFMEQGIFYYNFALRDHSEPTLGGILDMVKVMAFALTEGKVAVHCHAGLGRTGVLVACYLVYALRVRANDAIRFVRMKRANAVQTSGQILVVQEFEAFIHPQLYVFCNREFVRDKKNTEFTLQQYLHRQKTILHGYEARALKHIPKILYVICERLLKLCGCGGSDYPPTIMAPLEICFAIGTPAFTSFFLSSKFDNESSKVSYSAPLSIESPLFYSSLSSSRTDGTIHPSGDESESTETEEFSVGDVSLPNSAQYSNRRLNQDPDVPSCVSAIHENNIDHLLNDGVKDQQITENSCFQELASQDDLRKQSQHEKAKICSPKDILEALLLDHSLMNSEFKKLLKVYRIDLNVKQSAWDKLMRETNIPLLTGLLFTWLEHLKQPILTVDALSYVVLTSHKPEACLRKLDTEIRYTLEYIVRFVSRLHPLSRDQVEYVMRRFIASITQQAVPVRETLLPAVTEKEQKTPQPGKPEKKRSKRRNFTKLREGTLRKCIEFMMKFYDIVHFDNRSDSVSSANSSTPSTTACMTPLSHVNHPNFQDEDQMDINQ